LRVAGFGGDPDRRGRLVVINVLGAAALAVIVIVNPAPTDPVVGSPDSSYSAPDATGSGVLGQAVDGASSAAPADGPAIDLAEWKLTLPTGSQGKPTEVDRPRLDASTANPWFRPTSAGGVAFRAPVNGVTTSGSHYPRSELREMSGDGSTPAGWSASAGAHAMRVVEAFTHLPSGKAELVGAQIHDATHDITVFRLEGSSLYVTSDNNPHFTLVTSNYTLGTPFEAGYVIYQGQITAYFNGNQVATLPAPSLTGAYFKAGAYAQANCTNAPPCSADNYGETVIYQLAVSHADTPPGRN
jgi:hypothetical protein